MTGPRWVCLSFNIRHRSCPNLLPRMIRKWSGGATPALICIPFKLLKVEIISTIVYMVLFHIIFSCFLRVGVPIDAQSQGAVERPAIVLATGGIIQCYRARYFNRSSKISHLCIITQTSYWSLSGVKTGLELIPLTAQTRNFRPNPTAVFRTSHVVSDTPPVRWWDGTSTNGASFTRLLLNILCKVHCFKK